MLWTTFWLPWSELIFNLQFWLPKRANEPRGQCRLVIHPEGTWIGHCRRPKNHREHCLAMAQLSFIVSFGDVLSPTVDVFSILPIEDPAISDKAVLGSWSAVSPCCSSCHGSMWCMRQLTFCQSKLSAIAPQNTAVHFQMSLVKEEAQECLHSILVQLTWCRGALLGRSGLQRSN